MPNLRKPLPVFIFVLAALLFAGSFSAFAKDFHVTGRITDVSGRAVAGAEITMTTGNFRYRAVTGQEGYYNLTVAGIYSDVKSLLETGAPYPNPFSEKVYVPFIISRTGDVKLAVYSLQGRKVTELIFPGIEAGSYRIAWNGCSSTGVPLPGGFYIYAITSSGFTQSGRLVKLISSGASGVVSSIEQMMLPPAQQDNDRPVKLNVITSVSKNGYYPVRLTDITVNGDTLIDFVVSEINRIPFRSQGDHIAMYLDPDYRPLILKGINLGACPPGYFPGEIAYAISPEYYEKWIQRIGQAGFNSIRIYTLHPPVFYEKLANYNQRHQDHPILLFQGIWLEEVNDPSVASEYDLSLRSGQLVSDMQEVIDCVHGERNVAFRPGKAYGNYNTDVSRWTAGYILGREIAPAEVDSTDRRHVSVTSFEGSAFSISGASASEVFVAAMLDATVQYENSRFNSIRPVSISSWPTLDPLVHPTETHSDEDKASIDISKIIRKGSNAGLFAIYHAYPYYPNFISTQPAYLGYSDATGPDSYKGYLDDLKNHYRDIPLIIGEFGVPSSWGSAHWSYSGMEHGGYSEKEQGVRNIRLMKNIVDTGCGGGFMFSWIDEWFKRTWIVEYLEAFGFRGNSGMIPTRQLWHNLASPEQNFGLIGFEEKDRLPFTTFPLDDVSGPVTMVSGTNDNSCFQANISFRQNINPGDTIMIAFDTYSGTNGESMLPNGHVLSNRSEFMLHFVAGQDHAIHHVTQAYDMNGLTPRFNLTDPAVQKFRSIPTDGSPWVPMKWINDGKEATVSYIGNLPAENSSDFTTGNRTAVAWNGNTLKIRIPWTLLYFFDPTQMQVIDGATTEDGGRSFTIREVKSDGIALSVYSKRKVISTTARYNWEPWLVVPVTTTYEKASLQLVEDGLSEIPDFAN
ncbi:MAG TPA: T9SS type A sorting domain-containing protein [Bacteroidales bacterium]|nr:T9SS type A sorting domain-containing protein [Bacteroidales bacterium]